MTASERNEFSRSISKKMIASYKNLMKEYPQHQNYYKEIIAAFEEVLKLEK